MSRFQVQAKGQEYTGTNRFLQIYTGTGISRLSNPWTDTSLWPDESVPLIFYYTRVDIKRLTYQHIKRRRPFYVEQCRIDHL